jgi:outer membrane protein OmpU
VTLSGDARMGIVNPIGSDDVAFTSRARVKFTLTGETDGGLSFGAEFRADNASFDAIDAGDVGNGGAEDGVAGNVYISGAFGKLSMGDVDSAAKAAVGNVDAIFLVNATDMQESTFIAGGTKESVLYEYSTGSLGFYVSAGQISNDFTNTPDVTATPLALGVKYSTDAFTVALGYEDADDVGNTTHLIVGASTTFSGVTLKANYGTAQSDIAAVDGGSQFALSATYTADALAATVFYTDDEELGGSKAYGIGASYDLGGGAKVVGGYGKDKTADDDTFDLGIAMEF